MLKVIISNSPIIDYKVVTSKLHPAQWALLSDIVVGTHIRTESQVFFQKSYHLIKMRLTA